MMKVLMLNGSARENGNTYMALEEAGKFLASQGIDYEIFQIGAEPLRDCIGCEQCRKTRSCVFTGDKVHEFVEKAKDADGFVFGSPVYYAHPSGRILSFLDRVFYSSGETFAGKPGFTVAVARRAGTTASVDVLSKYFGISGMIYVGSTYWDVAHGAKAGQVQEDAEGLKTMRNSAAYLAWVMKLIESGKANGIEQPEMEKGSYTNFIR